MAYKSYIIALVIRIIILFIALLALAFAINFLDFNSNLPPAIIIITVLSAVVIYALYNLYKFHFKRYNEINDFFESIKYRDFSRKFNELTGSSHVRDLHKGFNLVHSTINEINKEKEAQHLYLKKILEFISAGIIAYDIETKKVLWVNEAFKKHINIPSIKNIQFIEKRNLKLFETIFKENHSASNSITLSIENKKVAFLISSSLFKVEETSIKLIVLQNIDDTVNKTETEAWKKLLSVMTHEIMNSIAPISSLSETLQSKIAASIEDEKDNPLDINDLETGIESIKKRSEGLLKFAKTYRSLNKNITLNLNDVLVKDLFENLNTLMLPFLENKGVSLSFKTDNSLNKIKMDAYLIEQVIINLILNAVEACDDKTDAEISIATQRNSDGKATINIQDNGKGIPKDLVDDVFIPFLTTKKAGNGIGLSISKEIMLLHKGQIQIQSIENKGTLVSLVF